MKRHWWPDQENNEERDQDAQSTTDQEAKFSTRDAHCTYEVHSNPEVRMTSVKTGLRSGFGGGVVRGPVLRCLFLFLCLLPCSSSSLVHSKYTGDLDALHLSPTGLDLVNWRHVPLGAGMVGVIDATTRDAGETLDQGPCLQINACFLAFVCDSQLDSHMPHAVFPWRVGLPITPTGFPHALGLNFTWDSMEHGHCSFSLPCFAGYALFVLTVAFLFCWKRVVSQQHDASLQHECMQDSPYRTTGSTTDPDSVPRLWFRQGTTCQTVSSAPQLSATCPLLLLHAGLLSQAWKTALPA